MIIRVYSLYDKKTCVYGRPFFAHNDGHALRLMGDEVANADSVIGKHADDFSLHWIGEFDDGLGVVVGVTPEN